MEAHLCVPWNRQCSQPGAQRVLGKGEYCLEKLSSWLGQTSSSESGHVIVGNPNTLDLLKI